MGGNPSKPTIPEFGDKHERKCNGEKYLLEKTCECIYFKLCVAQKPRLLTTTVA